MMQKRYPSPPSQESLEGEAAHFALAEQLLGRTVATGQITPQNVILTDDMLDGVDVALDYIRAKAATASGGLMVEHRVPRIGRIHDKCYGTLDAGAWLIGPTRRPTLFIADYKNGHKYVEAYMSPQLVGYAVGVMDAAMYSDLDVDLCLAIIQPNAYGRGGPVREWNVKAADVRPLVNKLSAAAHEALGDNPRCIPNPECRDCSARHACPALQLDAYASASISKGAVPFDLPPAAAGLELRILQEAQERLKARITGLEGQIDAQIRTGQHVPGWRLETSPGREVWHVPNAEVMALGDLLEVDLVGETKPITPNQARKAGIDAAIVAQYSHRPNSRATLVPDSGATGWARVFSGGM